MVEILHVFWKEWNETMNVNPTRRTFVSGILSVFGFLAGVGRTPPAEASPIPKKENPVPPPSTLRLECPQFQCATFVYDPGVTFPMSNVTTFVYDYGKPRQ
jgi:hypothetical protein